MHIVYEETKRMLRGMLPLALVTFGVFALCGQGIARSGASVLLGTAFALLLFYMICRSTVRATALSAGTGHSHYAARLCSSLHAHGGVRYRGDQAAVSERSCSGHSAVFHQGAAPLAPRSSAERRLNG